jgi:hypothetical protein
MVALPGRLLEWSRMPTRGIGPLQPLLNEVVEPAGPVDEADDVAAVVAGAREHIRFRFCNARGSVMGSSVSQDELTRRQGTTLAAYKVHPQ